MAIKRLPDDTRRLLSSVSIPSPDGLVKELVDNAIDAQATSVEVLVSANTIDKIEIRDNGTGIHPDDYQYLGRAGYTSKLRSFDEIDVASGMTLGFRGEALASARSLAAVVITTRRSDELVATLLKVDSAKGGVSSQKPTSAPVGTTVCATRLFGQLEVRAKCAVKDSVKTMARIKELLIAYAMARPSLRLTLKVIGNPKAGWAYSPKPGATAREAVLQLFGADTLAACCEKRSKGMVDDGAGGQYLVEAYLLSPTITLSASTMPKRSYISVDGRPVANRKGTMKKLIAIYKRHITNMADSIPEFKPADYFIQLNICCPAGSYDANIEPSKDDVIFVHEHLVVDQFEALCSSLYRSQPPPCIETLIPHRDRLENSTDSSSNSPPIITPRENAMSPRSMPWMLNMSDGFNRIMREQPPGRSIAPQIRPTTPYPPRSVSQTEELELPILRPQVFGSRDLEELAVLTPPIYDHHTRSMQLRHIPVQRTSTPPNNTRMPKFNSATYRRRPLPPWTPPSSIERNSMPQRPHGPTDGMTQSTIAFSAHGRPEIRDRGFVPINTSVLPTAPSYEVTSPPVEVLVETPAETTLVTGDPRAYLLRRQKSMVQRPQKLRRLKSCLMPLEVIPAEDQLHDLSHVATIDLHILQASMQAVKSFDRYLTDGANAEGLEMSIEEGRIIEGKVQKLVPSEAPGVNIVSLLKGKAICSARG